MMFLESGMIKNYQSNFCYIYLQLEDTISDEERFDDEDIPGIFINIKYMLI